MARHALHQLDPHVRATAAALVRQGWTLEQGRHLKLRSSSGRVCVLSSSASDHRAAANEVARLRRFLHEDQA